MVGSYSRPARILSRQMLSTKIGTGSKSRGILITKTGVAARERLGEGAGLVGDMLPVPGGGCGFTTVALGDVGGVVGAEERFEDHWLRCAPEAVVDALPDGRDQRELLGAVSLDDLGVCDVPVGLLFVERDPDRRGDGFAVTVEVLVRLQHRTTDRTRVA